MKSCVLRSISVVIKEYRAVTLGHKTPKTRRHDSSKLVRHVKSTKTTRLSGEQAVGFSESFFCSEVTTENSGIT